MSHTYMKLERSSEIQHNTYHVRQCSWCRKKLQDGDAFYTVNSLTGLIFCEDCKNSYLVCPIDFDPHGSKEAGTNSWKTARYYILWRDGIECRICGDYWRSKNPVEVHHIIPRKDGGTNHPKNLITLCQKHHTETYKNNYAGLELTDRHIQLGKQAVLSVNTHRKDSEKTGGNGTSDI